MKALLIDSEAREVREVEWTGHSDIIRLVTGTDGCFCVACCLAETDEPVYVDDEGLCKPTRHFFRIADRPDDQPLAGNGLVTGVDAWEDGREITRDVATTAADLLRRITWLTRAEVDQWALDHSAGPGITFASIEDGRIHSEQIATLGEVFGRMPKPD